MKKILRLLLVMLLTSQMSFAVDGLRYDGTYETDVANETSVVPVNDNGIDLPTWFKVVLMTEAVLMCATIVGFSYCSSNMPLKL